MMLEQDGCTDKGLVRARPSAVLVADPGGRLKLARWRLHGDGHRVHYVQDPAMIRPLIENEAIRAVIVNVNGPADFELLKSIGARPGSFGIVAVTSPNLAQNAAALGVHKTVTRPIDFPKLSAAVKEVIANPIGHKQKNKSRVRWQKAVSLALAGRLAYKTVLGNLKTAVLLVDAAGRITFANSAMSSLLPAEPGIIGRPYRDVLVRSGFPAYCGLAGILDETMRNREATGSVDVTVPGEAGEPVSCEARAYPVLNRRGDLTGACLVIEDVSSPKKLEKFMAQSEKLALVGQLAAGAAHEIRNPLTSVRGFIQLLQNELQGTPKVDYINIIIDEIDRVNTIINEFLKLAKPATPNRTPKNLLALFEDIRLLVEGEAFLKNVTIVEDFPEDLPEVLIDVEQIKQVFINVIRNAFEAMADGGKLTVRAYGLPGEREVCVEMADTGTGMDEETLKKVFRPFFTTKDNGTGLGLAVSSQIMESHGGRLEVRSKKGKGTTIYLYFPRE